MSSYFNRSNIIKYIAPDGKEYEPIVRAENETLDIKATAFKALGTNSVHMQDLGRGSNKYSYTFIFAGNDHDTESTSFMNSLKVKGAGKLITRFADKEIPVQVVSIKRIVNFVENVAQTTFYVEFIETLEQTPIPSSSVLEKIINLNNVNKAKLGSNLSLLQKIDETVSEANQIENVAEQIDTVPSKMLEGFQKIDISKSQVVTNTEEFIQTLANAYNAGYNSLINTQGLVDSLTETYKNMEHTLETKMYMSAVDRYNQLLSYDTYRAISLIGLSQTITDIVSGNSSVNISTLSVSELTTQIQNIMYNVKKTQEFIELKTNSNLNIVAQSQNARYKSNGAIDNVILDTLNNISQTVWILLNQARKEYEFTVNNAQTNLYSIIAEFYIGVNEEDAFMDIKKRNNMQASWYIYIPVGTKLFVTI